MNGSQLKKEAKRVAVVQSNYIPWKGYFDLIQSVDEFVLYDDVQYTKRDWRNRNKIKTPNGLHWLTIPVCVKGRYFQSIRETLVSDPSWAAKHWKSLVTFYRRAPYFKLYEPDFEPLFLGPLPNSLSEINRLFIDKICSLLAIQTRIRSSDEFTLNEEGPNEKLISICSALQATEYVSGPAAKDYLSPELFAAQGISVSFFSYLGYEPYTQLYPPFSHEVSILDLLFNVGPESASYMFNSRSRRGKSRDNECGGLRC